MTFAERLRTVQVDGTALETRTKRLYYDEDAMATSFPGMGDRKDRAEQFRDATDGLGLIKTAPSGRLYRSEEGRKVPLTEKQTRSILGEVAEP
jgi:hypothetical protein